MMQRVVESQDGTRAIGHICSIAQVAILRAIAFVLRGRSVDFLRRSRSLV